MEIKSDNFVNCTQSIFNSFSLSHAPKMLPKKKFSKSISVKLVVVSGLSFCLQTFKFIVDWRKFPFNFVVVVVSIVVNYIFDVIWMFVCLRAEIVHSEEKGAIVIWIWIDKCFLIHYLYSLDNHHFHVFILNNGENNRKRFPSFIYISFTYLFRSFNCFSYFLF